MALPLTKRGLTALWTRRSSCPCHVLRKASTSTGGQPTGDPAEKLYPSHFETSALQKLILFAGSAAVGLSDPWRSDMVAVNGEVFGTSALTYMYSRMKANPEGRLVLKERPRISTKTVDYQALANLPENTLGKVVSDFNKKHKISPDTRATVQFVDDPELAYVMQRYREVHDLLHALLDMPTDMVGEVSVKWVEALQFGLPMAVGGALLGPARFKKPSQIKRYEELYRPWAIRVGTKSRFLLNVYYEMRWEQDIDDLRREMRIPTLQKR